MTWSPRRGRPQRLWRRPCAPPDPLPGEGSSPVPPAGDEDARASEPSETGPPVRVLGRKLEVDAQRAVLRLGCLTNVACDVRATVFARKIGAERTEPLRVATAEATIDPRTVGRLSLRVSAQKLKRILAQGSRRATLVVEAADGWREQFRIRAPSLSADRPHRPPESVRLAARMGVRGTSRRGRSWLGACARRRVAARRRRPRRTRCCRPIRRYPQSAPLTQINLGTAFDRLARPLVDVPVLVADTGLDLEHPEIAPRLFSILGPDLVGDPDQHHARRCADDRFPGSPGCEPGRSGRLQRPRNARRRRPRGRREQRDRQRWRCAQRPLHRAALVLGPRQLLGPRPRRRLPLRGPARRPRRQPQLDAGPEPGPARRDRGVAEHPLRRRSRAATAARSTPRPWPQATSVPLLGQPPQHHLRDDLVADRRPRLRSLRQDDRRHRDSDPGRHRPGQRRHRATPTSKAAARRASRRRWSRASRRSSSASSLRRRPPTSRRRS